MDIPYVEKHTIFETIVGSRAYGIHTPDSDYDKSGVMIPGKDYFYGFNKFEQFQGYPNEDRTIYDIRKALMLIQDNNPNMLDLLYTPEHCIVKMTPYWKNIMEHRNLFLSKRCRYTFSGYAIAQLERIKTHKKFLLNPMSHKPKRSEYGLSEQSMFPSVQLKALMYSVIEMIIDEERPNFLNELDSIYSDYIIPLLARFVIPEQRSLAMDRFQTAVKSQANTLLSLGTQYVKEEYYEMAKKEVAFYEAQKEWERYEQWKKTRNPKRAELEAKFNMDTKHAAHLVRLMRLGMEALELGTIRVDRTGIDAEELKAIRNEGIMSFEQLEEYAKKMDADMGILYNKSNLQRAPQTNRINDLCVETVEKYLKENNF